MRKILILTFSIFLLSAYTHAQSVSRLTMEEVLALAQETVLNDGVAEGEKVTGLTREEVLGIAKQAVLAEGDIPEKWFSNDARVRFYSNSNTWTVMFIAKDGNEMVRNVLVNFVDVYIKSDGSVQGMLLSR